MSHQEFSKLKNHPFPQCWQWLVLRASSAPSCLKNILDCILTHILDCEFRSTSFRLSEDAELTVLTSTSTLKSAAGSCSDILLGYPCFLRKLSIDLFKK